MTKHVIKLGCYKLNNSGDVLLHSESYYIITKANLISMPTEDMKKINIGNLKNAIIIAKLSGIKIKYMHEYEIRSERQFFESIDALISR